MKKALCLVALALVTGDLTQGRYSAKIAVLACSACGDLVKKALKDVPGIEAPSVDSEKSMVEFWVKKGAHVPQAALQKPLDAAATEMGMGADFTLSKIKKLKKSKL